MKSPWLIPVVLMAAAPLAAQKPTSADTAGVRQAALDYVDAIYQVDTTLVVKSVRPDMAKRGFYVARGQTGYSSGSMTYAGLITTAKTWNAKRAVDPATAPREVKILDMLDQTASVKLTAQWGIDYMHLAKYDGKWMIVNVIWQSHPR